MIQVIMNIQNITKQYPSLGLLSVKQNVRHQQIVIPKEHPVSERGGVSGSHFNVRDGKGPITFLTRQQPVLTRQHHFKK